MSEIERLRAMLVTLNLIGTIREDCIMRRIFALEKEIDFSNPFSDEDEVLFKLWR